MWVVAELFLSLCSTVVLEQRGAYLVPGAHFGAFAEKPVHHVKLIFPHGNYERRVALLLQGGCHKRVSLHVLCCPQSLLLSPR